MKYCLNSLFLLFCVIVVSMGFTCGVERIDYTYRFSGKFTLTPYKKVYSINDTIKLQYKTADKALYDNMTNRTISTDSTYFNLVFQYVQRFPVSLSNYDTLALMTTPTGVNPDVHISNGYNWTLLKTNCNNSPNYLVELTYVLKKAGIFTIKLPTCVIQDCPLRKNKIPFSELSFSYDLPDCNKDVYMSIPAADRKDSLDVTISLELKRAFVLKVE